MKSLLSRKRISIIVLLIILGVIVSIWRTTTQTQARSGQEINTATIQYKNLKKTLTLSATITSDNYEAVRFPVSGKIIWIGVKEGDAVAKNQVLAKLDARDIEKNLQKKLNTYLDTRWDFEQTQDDYDIHGRKMEDLILTDEEKRILEQSQFGLNNAVLDVEIQNLALEQSVLKAPFSGIITRIDVPYAGFNITPAGAEFEIVNPDAMYASVLADQNEVTKISINQHVDLILDAYPDQAIHATVSSIAFTPKTGESTTVYEVKAPLPHSDIAYRIGMTADAQFVVLDKPHTLSIPSKYLFTDDQGAYAYIYEGTKKQRTPVIIGEEFDEDVEILEGLTAGQKVYD